jgi:hypothetical protein
MAGRRNLEYTHRRRGFGGQAKLRNMKEGFGLFNIPAMREFKINKS